LPSICPYRSVRADASWILARVAAILGLTGPGRSTDKAQRSKVRQGTMAQQAIDAWTPIHASNMVGSCCMTSQGMESFHSNDQRGSLQRARLTMAAKLKGQRLGQASGGEATHTGGQAPPARCNVNERPTRRQSILGARRSAECSIARKLSPPAARWAPVRFWQRAGLQTCMLVPTRRSLPQFRHAGTSA
jgi:hypothetical protein